MQVAAVKRGKYAEAFRVGIVFAFAQKQGEEINVLTEMTTCKDFLNDMIWTEKTGRPTNIYSYKWDKKDILNDNLVLIVSHDFPFTQEHVDNLKKVFNFWEQRLNIKTTEIELNGQNIILDFSPQWYDRPYLFSLFTMLTFLYNMNEVPEEYDKFMNEAFKTSIESRKSYFENFRPVCKKIYNDEIKDYLKYEEVENVSSAHCNLGLQKLTYGK
jgi:hypothetical protein